MLEAEGEAPQGQQGGGEAPTDNSMVGTENLFNSSTLENSGLAEEWAALQEKKQQTQQQKNSEPVNPVQQALSEGNNSPQPETNESIENNSSTTDNPLGVNPESGDQNTNLLENTDAGDAESANDPLVIESPLFGGQRKIGGNSTPSPQPDFENINEINAYLEKTHGIKDMSQLSERLNFYQQAEQNYQQNEQKLNGFSQLFDNMDADLWEAVNAYANGNDWRATLATPTVDFSKDVSQVDLKTLAEAFNPGKLTDADWQEYSDPEGDPNIKRMVDTVIETSKASFTAQKQYKLQSAQQEVQKQQQMVEKFNISLANSKAQLETEYSNISPSAMAQIEDAFVNNDVVSLFYEQDGTLKQDAFNTYAMAKFGKGLIKQFEAAAMRKAENKVTQDILSRTPETPRNNRGSATTAQPSGVSAEVQAMVEGMMGMEKRQY